LGVSTAQRLVRLNCSQCKQAYSLEPDSPERCFLGAGPDEKVTLYIGKGCPACDNQGYRGRMAIHEVLPATAELRRLIVNSELSEEAVSRSGLGMNNLRKDGIRKILAGLTTIEEVRRVL